MATFHGEGARRGRSAAGFIFTTQPLAPALTSLRPYAFRHALMLQNEFVTWREDNDPVFRGDVAPEQSCTGNVSSHPWEKWDNGGDSTDDDEEDELTSTASASSRPTTPDVATHPVTPDVATRPVPTSAWELPMSPLTPPAPSRKASPVYVQVATAWRARLVTYSGPAHKHAAAERAAREAKEREAKAATIKRAKELDLARKRMARARGPNRRSARLLRYRIGPSHMGTWDTDRLVQMGLIIHDLDPSTITPLVDKRNYVMAVIAGPPKGEIAWWRNAVFPYLGHEESRVRFGIGYGEEGPYPHRIKCHASTLLDVAAIRSSDSFEAISEYQNHVVHQIAPKSYAKLQYQMSRLQEETDLSPVFSGSIFTTCEISYGDGPPLSRKNLESKFDAMEVLTISGSYDWKERGLLLFWDDHGAFPLRPGSTVTYPAGTKHFSFIPVAPHETFYVFRQYCHAGVMRWIEKDFRSDAQFEEEASDEELADMKEARESRGRNTIKNFTKIHDVYVF
ncbi:hypothetical protein DFH07DRAFT_773000 [Mycena maculata]|uniref:Uncharacterized protein n=1 Tax=Mycena maculata TaxID=230809 RepID=A0AAD7J4G6_9AGAR|nr:hypothetical protein DFH07DRAFT_773000 [Mycena maculata]